MSTNPPEDPGVSIRVHCPERASPLLVMACASFFSYFFAPGDCCAVRACYLIEDPLSSRMRRSLLALHAGKGSLPGGLQSGLPGRWGVVQPVGHLTVNEDGEGSNPSAPANFFLLKMMVSAAS